MKTTSHVENEVNQIRLKIYEETKGLTKAQYEARLDRITEDAARKYGFEVVADPKEVAQE